MLLEMSEAQAITNTLGIEITKLEIRRPEAGPGLRNPQGRGRCTICPGRSAHSTNRIRINTLANAARLSTMHGERAYVEAGGLMSYGPNFPDLFRRAAEYVDKILRGTKPGDIPVEQPTKFDLVLSLTAAKALGIEIPPTLLARADEVIE